MAISAEEEETLEAIKRWWNDSGKQIAMGIAVVAIVYFGWQFWNRSQTNVSAEASALYDQLTGIAVISPDATLADENRQRANELVQQIKAEYADSVYALYAALFGAKLSVDVNNLDAAKEHLEWLLANTRSGLFGATDPTLIALASLRLGRVLLAQGQGAQALTVLGGAEPGALAAEFEELRGDIYMSQGQREEALTAYQAALDTGNPSPVLQLKLNELQSSR
ncbi:tetratricopeptide repeat protein [Gammaproteobacteria bacterium LSUCC0112]|nr:tetratricopeptide repeat protein [Gammaproteobacteria bacterium LSUCC0112]